jgi:hypothetical protein
MEEEGALACLYEPATKPCLETDELWRTGKEF